MKFCKNLQQIVDIADPEWAPYWTNYKMLKKLIKELPSLVPSDDVGQSVKDDDGNRVKSPVSMTSSISSDSIPINSGGNAAPQEDKESPQKPTAETTDDNQSPKKENIGTSPGERAFFKYLRAELNKATRFFERAKQELQIRDERVRDGIAIMKKPGSTMVTEKWSAMAKAVYRLYKDMLLLELYAIMTYTSFSKILKKHDKNTGYDTRVKFMANVVNQANFTHYPDLLEMISDCEAKYEEVDKVLVTEGKSTSALDEDERLFISMIHRFYGQIMDKAEAEGADVAGRKESLGRRQSMINASPNRNPGSGKTSSLQLLIEENEANKSASLSDDADDDKKGQKRTLDIVREDNTKKLKK